VTQDCISMNAVGWFCAKQLESAKWNTENFDNIFYAFINVYQVISLEGWSDIMMVS